MICSSSTTALTAASFPSQGYVYLVFESEKSVRALLQACSQDLLSPDGLSEYYFKMSSRRMRCKEVSRAGRAAWCGSRGCRGTSLGEREAGLEQQLKACWLLAAFDSSMPVVGMCQHSICVSHNSLCQTNLELLGCWQTLPSGFS